MFLWLGSEAQKNDSQVQVRTRLRPRYCPQRPWVPVMGRATSSFEAVGPNGCDAEPWSFIVM